MWVVVSDRGVTHYLLVTAEPTEKRRFSFFQPSGGEVTKNELFKRACPENLLTPPRSPCYKSTIMEMSQQNAKAMSNMWWWGS
jgi:hypothetical protein